MTPKTPTRKRTPGARQPAGTPWPEPPADSLAAELVAVFCDPPAVQEQAGAPAPSSLAAALRLFDQAARQLELTTDDRMKLLNLGRTKLFESLKDPVPRLDVDQADRLGYFLAIYELSGRLVGSSAAWMKAPNSAPLFAGRSPMARMLEGRMADLIDTLGYLQGAYGGWA